MDPLSIPASVAAILCALRDVLHFLGDLKDAEQSRAQVVEKLSVIQSAVRRLERLGELRKESIPLRRRDAERAQIESVTRKSKDLLDSLQTKFAQPSGKSKRSFRRLLWRFQQRDVSQKLQKRGPRHSRAPSNSALSRSSSRTSESQP